MSSTTPVRRPPTSSTTSPSPKTLPGKRSRSPAPWTAPPAPFTFKASKAHSLLIMLRRQNPAVLAQEVLKHADVASVAQNQAAEYLGGCELGGIGLTLRRLSQRGARFLLAVQLPQFQRLEPLHLG